MTYSAADVDRVRRKVLDAWDELVAEHGYSAVSVGDVAKRAELARSSLYRYFPTKESLYLANLEERIALLVAAMRAEVAELADAPTRLRRLMVTEMRELARSPKIALSDVPDELSREGHRRLLDCFAPLRDLVREILDDGRQTGTLPALDVESALPVVFACIDVFREHLSGSAVERDRMADDVADFVLRGLGAFVEPTARGAARRGAPQRSAPKSVGRGPGR
jgi:AcrR family transcriptional regulator